MPNICYIPKNFRSEALAIIDTANAIITDYADRGYSLTLRQLYYQFVSRDLIPNNDRSYKKLSGVINDARLAGRIDWCAIEDRTRNLQTNSHWDHPGEILATCVDAFNMNLWEDQSHYCEVWVEKDALVGVVGKACVPLDVPFFACRGYVSQSEMWVAAQRLIRHAVLGKTVTVFHLGDHDPSGIDMTRDIQARLDLFEADARVTRLALNEDQVDQYNPPPNPAKVTDARFLDYQSRFGDECWELDALDPDVIVELIEGAIKDCIQWSLFADRKALIASHRQTLRRIADNWAQ